MKRWQYGMRVEMASGRRRRSVRVRTQGAAAIATDRRETDRDRESRYQQEASVLVCASWSDDSRSRSSCAEENRTNKGCCRIITIAHTCGSYSSSSSSDTCRHHHQYHHCRPLGRRLSSSPHFLSTADTNSLLLLSSKVRRGKGREGKKN